MDCFKTYLLRGCDALIGLQPAERTPYAGGFFCRACGFYHGRADNAVYPLCCAYLLTKDEKYLFAVRRLLLFRAQLAQPDGSVRNDFDNDWRGVTVFSAIGLYKALRHAAGVLPDDLRSELQTAFTASAEWVYREIAPGYKAYINYFAAASAVNAMAFGLSGEERFAARSRELLDYCLSLFSENGILAGEGQPHGGRSGKGCIPADIGYNAEESLPCLVDAAVILGDEERLSVLARHAAGLLDFLLPDGAWDNSFGLRNNKWTYYGSRTSDGAVGMLTILGKRSPVFTDAARRNFRLLERCTRDGVLYGGARYAENGQRPCIHHTMTHLTAVADAVMNGLTEGEIRTDTAPFVKYYPEIDTVRLHKGAWTATVTAYDFFTGNAEKGAAHASGGTLSLLYHDKAGPVIAGSVYDYRRTEPLNMQFPSGHLPHRTLLPRTRLTMGSSVLTTCLDEGAVLSRKDSPDAVVITTRAHFVNEIRRFPAGKEYYAELRYSFSEDAVGIEIRFSPAAKDAVFILPLIAGAAKITTPNRYSTERIFFLTPGFDAEEYTLFPDDDRTIRITIHPKEGAYD